jgi:hypothetical protein
MNLLYHNPCNWAAIARSVQRLATGWTVRGSNPGGGEIFRTRPHRVWGPHYLLYKMGNGSLPGVKRPYLAPMLKKEYSYTATPPPGIYNRFKPLHVSVAFCGHL